MAGRFFIEKVQKMPVDKQEKLAYTMKKAVMLRYTLHNVRQRNIVYAKALHNVRQRNIVYAKALRDVRQRNIAYASTLHNRRIARLLYHTASEQEYTPLLF